MLRRRKNILLLGKKFGDFRIIFIQLKKDILRNDGSGFRKHVDFT